MVNKDKNIKEFIKKAKEAHPNENLDFSKVEYVNNRTKVCIIDHDLDENGNEYGEFWITPWNLICGRSHPKKKGKKISEAKALSQDEVIERFLEVHKGENLDYSQVDYKNMHTKVKIIDPVYGEYYQEPAVHLKGSCNPLRGRVNSFYDYSNFVYINSKTKGEVVCPLHGKFYISPNHLLSGRGCPECGKERISQKLSLGLTEFIKRAREIHGDKYNYNNVKYVNSYTKVEIVCPRHGSFFQTPNDHLMGHGCPDCGKEECINKNKSNKDEFIEKVNKIHGDNNFDFSKFNYINSYTKGIVICPKHGEFYATPNSLLSGRGCPECGKIKTGDLLRYTNEDFIKLANDIHGVGKYDYSKVEYKDADTPVKIICPIHGAFMQRPHCHLEGKGCPKCGKVSSKGETEIVEYLKNLLPEETIIERDRSVLENKKELDIYLPNYNLAIEFDGLLWHCEKYNKDRFYHLEKTELCKEKGIRLVHIFEDEWNNNKEIVLNKLKHFVNKDNKSVSIGARKCDVKEINKDQAELFLNTYHIQGFVGSTTYLGAFYGDELIGVMTFKQEAKNSLKYELNRFATNTNYRLPGIASKLFKYFTENYKCEEIKSFLDRRWNDYGNTVYEKLGFDIDYILKPDYYYTDGYKRLHKFGFRKNILRKKYKFDLNMTEKQMAEYLGFYRIYNCGLVKYVWKRKLDK